MLAGFRSCDAHLGVHGVGGGDDHRVDVGSQQLLVVGKPVALDAGGLAERSDILLVRI